MSFQNPRIKPIYPLYQLNPEVFRIGAQLGITTEFEDPENQYWELAKILDGRHIDEVVKEMQTLFPSLTEEDVIGGIELLESEGVLEEALPEQEIQDRYIANVNYFSRFTNTQGNRFDIQRKMNDTRILLLGLGGGGSNILTLLAGLGPKKITIVDYDRVEASNLGRQFLYRESDIGRLKIEVAEEALSQMNSNITIESHNKKIVTVEDVLLFTNDADVVICAIDEPPFVIHRIVNQAIVRAGLPCVFGASQVSRGRVYTVIPRETGCFDCLNLNFSKNDPKFIEQFVGFREINFDPPSIAYGPGIFQLTSGIVDELVRLVTNYATPRSLGTQYEINYEDGSSFRHPSWPRFPKECPTCGEGKVDDWEIFQYYEGGK
ncbi:ThiF family adenylyltransferase [Lysinibacillus sp. TE18511]